MELVMRMTVRGWSRNMGERTLADFSLDKCKKDVGIYPDQRALFKNDHVVKVIWGEQLNLGGEYFCCLSLDREDLVHLVRMFFDGQQAGDAECFLRQLPLDNQTICALFLERVANSSLADVVRGLSAQLTKEAVAGVDDKGQRAET